MAVSYMCAVVHISFVQLGRASLVATASRAYQFLLRIYWVLTGGRDKGIRIKEALLIIPFQMWHAFYSYEMSWWRTESVFDDTYMYNALW